MNALTNIQYINNEQGVPTFAVMPIATLNWLKQKRIFQTLLKQVSLNLLQNWLY